MALTDAQYKDKEARMEAGIVAGNALNAAAAVYSGTNKEPLDVAGDILELADAFEEFLYARRDKAGKSPFLTVEATGSTAAEADSSGPEDAPKDIEAAVAVVDDAGVTYDQRSCPDCGGETWDNREKKQSGAYKPSAPDFSCKDKSCGGKVWPKKARAPRRSGKPSDRAAAVAASV